MYMTIIYDPDKCQLSFTTADKETLILPNFLTDKNGLQVSTINENDQKVLLKKIINNL